MHKIVLKRNGEIVGDLGEYDDLQEAAEIVRNYNTKPSRRGATAEVIPKRNPGKLGSLFVSHSEESEESEESEYFEDDIQESQEDEYSEDSEDSESDVSTEKIAVYRNPMDLWPIDNSRAVAKQPTQKKINAPRESITKKRKRLTRTFRAPHTISVQAVMIDDDGYVLIRKPSNRYKGIKWEFYGGKVDGGEDIETALRREMLEETGYTINLVDKIGEISLDGGIQKYFLISPQSQIQEPTMETENTFWVSQDEAWSQLGKNKEPYRRKLRSVLDQAYSRWRLSHV